MPLSKQIIFDILDAIPQLMDTVELKVDVLMNRGYIPAKSRDPREPKRHFKIRVEKQLRELFIKRFTRQLERLRYGNFIQYKARKKPLPPPLPDWEEEEWLEELFAVVFTALKYGIELFSEEISVGIDYTMSNVEAMTYARKYASDLVKGIDETTGAIIENAIGDFVDKPGFNIGNIIDQLIDAGMTEKRAASIAVTETTRAFAEGQLEAARQFQKEYPDFTIVKRWETNADDRVCDICGPLQGEEVPIEDNFSNGELAPPAHPNCRCWINHYTKEGADVNR